MTHSIGVHKGHVYVSVPTAYYNPSAATDLCMEILAASDRARIQRTIARGGDPTKTTIMPASLSCKCGHEWESAVAPGNVTRCPQCKKSKRRSTKK